MHPLEQPLLSLAHAHVLTMGVLHEDGEVLLAEPRTLLPEEWGLGDAAETDAGERDTLDLVELGAEEVGWRQ